MEQIIPVDTGAEALIELFNANGVEYVFLNPGTDTYPVQEAVAKFKALNKRTPEVILCLHESLALAAAHGYFMITGRPQVVIVHSDLGLQQVGGALHNAQRGRIGVVLCSGRVPANIETGRSNQVHWLQEQFDQPGIVRGYVKWEYELRSTENIHQAVQRAFQISANEPSGPVYLCLSQDVIAADMKEVHVPDVSRFRSLTSQQAEYSTLEEVASILADAEDPLLISSYSGRHPGSVAQLIQLAETLGLRVVDSPLRMNFPNTHPLYCGFEPEPYLDKADVILVIDNDVPYIPSRAKPSSQAKIIQVDVDPLKENMPLWGFPVDISVCADSEKVIAALNKIIGEKITQERQTRWKIRSHRIKMDHERMKQNWSRMASSAASKNPISPEWLCKCINEVVETDALIIGEPVTNRAALLRQISRSKAGTYFQSGGSNLGWGLGAAVGAKLANPDKLVVSLMGDGSFVFGCPTAALWAASVYHAPFLCVVFNNQRYNAPSLALRHNSGRKSYAEQTGNWVGINIKPSPDYSLIAQACGAFGQKVEDPAELPFTLRNAVDQVSSGKTTILDVRIDIS